MSDQGAKGWSVRSLKDLSLKITKGTTPTSLGMGFEDAGINFIKAESITRSGLIDESTFAYVSEKTHEKLKRSQIKADDVLVTIAGIYLAKIGLVKREHVPANTNQAVAIVRPDKQLVAPEYLKAYLSTSHVNTYLNGLCPQAAQPNLNLTQLGKFSFPLPPLPVQQKIAAILTAYDDLIENNRQRIALLEKMAEEIYREWFVRLRFPGHEHTPVHKGVPEGWELKHLPDCISVKPPETIDPQDPRPFIGMDRLSTTSALFTVEEHRVGASGPRFRNGDTLLPRITPCLENGKRGFVMCLEDDEVASGSTEFIVLRGKTLPPEFVYCLSVSDGFRKHCENSMVGASGRQRVHEGCLNWVLIKHPPQEIAQKFSEITSPMYRQAKCLLDQNAKLEGTRDLLLNRLISGKLRVDDLDIQFPPSMQRDAA